jgi:hypothetical protein
LINKIIKIIKENPDCVIYYHDNQSWIICTKEEFKKAEKEERDVNELMAGDDSDAEGYAPDIVTALAKMLKVTVKSV